jgi:ADP-heptose:LPS heptosyltransferase
MDRHLGSLICFLLSGVSRLLPKPKFGESHPVRNILLIELFEMGASIMTYPAVLYLLEQAPHARIHVLTTRSIRPSWLKISEIDPDCIHGLEEKSIFAFLFSFWRIRGRLNRLPLDLVIDFELFFRITAIFSFFLRAHRRGGFQRYHLEGLYRGSIYDTGCHFNQNSHISRNFLALTKTIFNGTHHMPEHKAAIGLEELRVGSYKSQPTVRQGLDQKTHGFLLSPYILVAPDVGPNLPVRNYPLDRLQIVIRQLLVEFPDHQVGLIGTKENQGPCEDLQNRIGAQRTMVLAGNTSMDELFELLLGARLLISNDNGPIHFAALTQTPTLALFSTDSPFVYGPLGKSLILYSYFQCSPCIMAYNHKQSYCTDNKCLQAIAPEAVLDLACRMLKGNPDIRYRTINNQTPYLT